jgi:antitoxin HicB
MTKIAYNILVVPDTEDGGYYAYIPDLQGCMGDGETPQDAVLDVIAAAKCWEDVRADQGRTMPEPGEAERAFDAEMQEKDEYISELESQIAALKSKLRRAERMSRSGRTTGFSKSVRGFQAA